MGLVARAEQSRADETGFTLELAQPGGGQFRATVVGGQVVQADIGNPLRGARTVTVRGQPGMELSTGAGSAVYWTEAGQVYGIISGPRLEDVLATANGLQPLDLAGWRQRLGAL